MKKLILLLTLCFFNQIAYCAEIAQRINWGIYYENHAKLTEEESKKFEETINENAEKLFKLGNADFKEFIDNNGNKLTPSITKKILNTLSGNIQYRDVRSTNIFINNSEDNEIIRDFNKIISHILSNFLNHQDDCDLHGIRFYKMYVKAFEILFSNLYDYTKTNNCLENNSIEEKKD